MLQRCYNPRSQGYADYGGRGIDVCAAWRHSYATFRADMGARPPGTSLGRIDNEGPYSPENCRWETFAQQNDNKRTTVFVEHEGRRVKLVDLCRERGLSRGVVYGRLKTGWSLALALSKAPRSYRPVL